MQKSPQKLVQIWRATVRFCPDLFASEKSARASGYVGLQYGVSDELWESLRYVDQFSRRDLTGVVGTRLG